MMLSFQRFPHIESEFCEIAVQREHLLNMYRKMMLIRRVDDKLIELWKRGENNSHNSYAGQEAVAVGACSALEPDDIITSNHRGLGHCLAKGVDLGKVFAEYLGRDTGLCRGKGGGMHLSSFETGVFGAYAIVGENIPVAAGIALASKMRKTGQVTLCFFGDGASNQGTFHEGLNLASILNVPVVYICENNGYAITVPVSYSVPIPNIADRASSYNIPGVVVDGMDVLGVYSAVKSAVDRARIGEGPTLIECKTYRYEGHFTGESAMSWMKYRTEEEIKEWQMRDPIRLFESKLKGEGMLTDKEIERLSAELDRKIKEAVDYAKNSPLPTTDRTLEDVFAIPIDLTY